MGAVVDDLAGAGHCAGFEEIDSEPVATVDAVLCAYTVFVQIGNACFGNVVFGQTGNEFSLASIVCERYGNVGFTAAESGIESVSLGETEIAGRSKPEHNLTEGNNLWHSRVFKSYKFNIYLHIVHGNGEK